MKSKLMTGFERSDGTQWVFVSGVVLGLAGNLLVNALSSRPLPCNSDWLTGVSLVLFSASICSAVLGWMLQQFEYIARSQNTGTGTDRETVKQRLVSASFGRLAAFWVLALLLAILGVVGLVFQPPC